MRGDDVPTEECHYLSYSDMGRAYEHNEAGRVPGFGTRDPQNHLHALFGTHSGLATGVDLKAIDAQISHTDSSCIRGWLTIQAMGRTERIDSSNLKKKSYALSSVHRTSLPNAHRDALFEADIDRPPLQPLEVPTNEEPDDEADVQALREHPQHGDLRGQQMAKHLHAQGHLYCPWHVTGQRKPGFKP